MTKKYVLSFICLVFIAKSFVFSLPDAETPSATSVESSAANGEVVGENEGQGKSKAQKKDDDIVFAEPSLASGILSFSEITLFSIGLNMWDR